MDDLKVYAKNEEHTNTIVRTVHVFRPNIGIEFGIKKCGVFSNIQVWVRNKPMGSY